MQPARRGLPLIWGVVPKNGRNMDEKMMHDNIEGIFDDDGSKIDPDSVPMPELCLTCKKADEEEERMLCLLNQNDQKGEADFLCGAYDPKV
jgi:hypothetical protein